MVPPRRLGATAVSRTTARCSSSSSVTTTRPTRRRRRFPLVVCATTRHVGVVCCVLAHLMASTPSLQGAAMVLSPLRRFLAPGAARGKNPPANGLPQAKSNGVTPPVVSESRALATLLDASRAPTLQEALDAVRELTESPGNGYWTTSANRPRFAASVRAAQTNGAALENTALPDVRADLQGAWRVEWSDLGKSAVDRAVKAVFQPSLRMLSFGVLPPLRVNVTSSFNVVQGDVYDLIQVFDDFAMRLRGPMRPVDEVDNAAPGARPGRVAVTFESVEVLPLEQNDHDRAHAGAHDACRLDALGLTAYRRELPIAKPITTFIDVTYLTRRLRVHKGASGKTYVLTRIDAAELPVAPPRRVEVRRDTDCH